MSHSKKAQDAICLFESKLGAQMIRLTDGTLGTGNQIAKMVAGISGVSVHTIEARIYRGERDMAKLRLPTHRADTTAKRKDKKAAEQSEMAALLAGIDARKAALK